METPEPAAGTTTEPVEVVPTKEAAVAANATEPVVPTAETKTMPPIPATESTETVSESPAEEIVEQQAATTEVVVVEPPAAVAEMAPTNNEPVVVVADDAESAVAVTSALTTTESIDDAPKELTKPPKATQEALASVDAKAEKPVVEAETLEADSVAVVVAPEDTTTTTTMEQAEPVTTTAELSPPENATANNSEVSPEQQQQQNTSATTATPSSSSKQQVLVLISRQSFDSAVLANQQKVDALFGSFGVKYSTLDGADPANKQRRDELFALSGLRAKYPQFFMVDGDSTTFWGAWDKFQATNDSGETAKTFGGQEQQQHPPNITVGVVSAPGATPEKTTTTTEKQVLVLLTRQSFDGAVIANQQKVETVFGALGVNYTTLDGADPANKQRRDELFAMSGLRAKYPQFFMVEGDSTTFWGAWDEFQATNDSGETAKTFGGQEQQPPTIPVGVVSSPVSNTTPDKTTAKQVLVLITRQSFDGAVIANQQKVETVFGSLGVNYTTLDGADPANKKKRDELFAMSGLRGKYPQFFIVEGDSTTFWGAWDKFQATNDNEETASTFGGQKPDIAAVTVGGKEEVRSTKQVLVLISGRSFDRAVLANQQKVQTVFGSLGVDYTTVDGAVPTNQKRRDELFALSGLRGKYPQFFMVEGGTTTFWGAWDEFQATNDMGATAQTFGGKESEIPVLSKPPPTADNSSHRVTENAASSKQVLVLISGQSFDREVIANQQKVFTVFDSNGVNYKTLDGADARNIDQRIKLFRLSGLHGKYPQFFVVDGGSTTFWGAWNDFQATIDSGDIADIFGGKKPQIPVADAAAPATTAPPSAIQQRPSELEDKVGKETKPSSTEELQKSVKTDEEKIVNVTAGNDTTNQAAAVEDKPVEDQEILKAPVNVKPVETSLADASKSNDDAVALETKPFAIEEPQKSAKADEENIVDVTAGNDTTNQEAALEDKPVEDQKMLKAPVNDKPVEAPSAGESKSNDVAVPKETKSSAIEEPQKSAKADEEKMVNVTAGNDITDQEAALEDKPVEDEKMLKTPLVDAPSAGESKSDDVAVAQETKPPPIEDSQKSSKAGDEEKIDNVTVGNEATNQKAAVEDKPAEDEKILIAPVIDKPVETPSTGES